jgi:hypothetical protein
MMFTYINDNERVSQNLYSICFHTDQPKRHECKKISMMIRNKGSINDNKAETKQKEVERLLDYDCVEEIVLFFVQIIMFTFCRCRI